MFNSLGQCVQAAKEGQPDDLEAILTHTAARYSAVQELMYGYMQRQGVRKSRREAALYLTDLANQAMGREHERHTDDAELQIIPEGNHRNLTARVFGKVLALLLDIEDEQILATRIEAHYEVEDGQTGYDNRAIDDELVSVGYWGQVLQSPEALYVTNEFLENGGDASAAKMLFKRLINPATVAAPLQDLPEYDPEHRLNMYRAIRELLTFTGSHNLADEIDAVFEIEDEVSGVLLDSDIRAVTKQQVADVLSDDLVALTRRFSSHAAHPYAASALLSVRQKPSVPLQLRQMKTISTLLNTKYKRVPFLREAVETPFRELEETDETWHYEFTQHLADMIPVYDLLKHIRK